MAGHFKTLHNFSVSTDDFPQVGEIRAFAVSGDVGAKFSIEVKNEDNYHYNFDTKVFESGYRSLANVVLTSGSYSGHITVPGVTDADEYTISLHVDFASTRHAKHKEVRRADGSYDTNSSTGSNSALLKRIIHQTLDKTITLSSHSPSGMAGSSVTTQALTGTRSLSIPVTPFSITTTAAADKAFQIIKNPSEIDIMTFVSTVVGGTPSTIPGENIYPTATTAFTGDDVKGPVTSGAVVRMDNTDLSAVIKVGDKITTPTTTSAESIHSVDDGTSVLTLGGGQVCADIMAVGDRVTAPTTLLYPFIANDKVIVVKTINHGGNTSKFEIQYEGYDDVEANDVALQLADESVMHIEFSSKINRSLTTVTVVETSGVPTDFTMSQDIQFRDNAPLTFFNQRNHSWPISSTVGIKSGMTVLSDAGSNGFATGTIVKEYIDATINFKKTAIDNRGQIPTLTTNATTNVTTVTQPGDVTFNNQALLSYAGATTKIFGYGALHLKEMTGYDVVFSDLKISLTPIVTTTTAAVSASTSVPVTSRNGILDSVSVVSGIGIDAGVVNPTVSSGAGAVTGAGTVVLSAAQTLEDGATLTFTSAGQVATITGNVAVNKIGNEDVTIRFDLDKVLSYT
jgi:hypothetical protein